MAASGPGRPSSAAPTSRPHHPALPNPSASAKDPSHDADFSNKLQKEMAALLGEIDESPEMRRQLEELMGELTAGAERALEEDEEGKDPTKAADGGDRSATAKEASQQSGGASAAAEPAFTDTIRRTMERMAESGQQASAAAQQGGVSEEDMLAQLLKEVAGGGGEASEEEFSKMLMGMMEQLTNKDILYEPMKELDTKFPDWMKANEGKVPKEDMRRYKEQQGLVEEIVARFERQGYSDENPQDREFIVERMQKVSQDCPVKLRTEAVLERRAACANVL